MTTSQKSPLESVNVFHGCEKMEHPTPERLAASWFFIKAIAGNTLPAATLPFGKYSCCLYTSGYPTGYGDNWPNSCSWNLKHLPEGVRFYGLSHFHMSGTGAIDTYYNLARLTPFFGKRPPVGGDSVVSEDGTPGYYAVRSGSGIFCKTTVSPNGAYHVFDFGREGGRLLFNVSGNGLNSQWSGQKAHRAAGKIEIAGENEIRAEVTIDGITHHFIYRYRHAHILGLTQDNRVLRGKAHSFDLDAAESFCGVILEADGDVIESRLVDSLVNFERAENELSVDEGGFDAVCGAARKAWEKALSTIEIEGASDLEREIFYSNFYHSLVKPSDRPGDSPFWDCKPGEDFTVDFCTLWDIYKTQMPLLMTLFPEFGSKVLSTFAQIGRAGDGFPIALMVDSDLYRCFGQAAMLAEYIICDAFWRGVPGDYDALLDLTDKDLAKPTIAEIVQGGTPRRLTHLLDVCEGCGNMADLAETLGRQDLAAKWRKIADRWTEAYDPATGLLHPDHEYYEGNYWNYSFRLLRHMDKRIELAGGVEKYITLLDRFFGFDLPELTDARFEGFNNESDMETHFAYHAAGRMDRIAEIIDAEHTFLFSSGRGAIPGNNDSGGLSSCFMWNAMGIFPMAGQNKMLVGSPRYKKVTLHLPGGRDFVIEHKGEGFTVVRATLDGTELSDFAFTASRMMEGGRLVLETK